MLFSFAPHHFYQNSDFYYSNARINSFFANLYMLVCLYIFVYEKKVLTVVVVDKHFDFGSKLRVCVENHKTRR